MCHGRPISSRLKPCAFHQASFPKNGSPDRQVIISRFAPFLMNRQETVTKTVYFSVPARGQSDDWCEEVDCIRIAFKVNNRWNRKTFDLDYAQIRTFEKERDNAALLKIPFAPSFFPEAQPLHLQGSIFDPVY